MNSLRYKDMGLFRFALNVEYFLKSDNVSLMLFFPNLKF